jgi:acyl carrier protein
MNEVAIKVMKLLTEISGNEPIDNPDIKFNRIDNWNSIHHAAFLHELEQTFGIQFSIDDLISIESPADVVKIILSHKNG